MKHKRQPQRLVCAVLTAALLLSSGCSAGSNLRLHAAEGRPDTAAGIDEVSGVVRVTTYGVQPEQGQVQLLEHQTVRSQTYTSLQEAAYPWERTNPPDLIVIGADWVKRHGYSSSWAGQLHRIGIKQGRQPQVLVVEGPAEQFLRQEDSVRRAMDSLAQLRFSGVMRWSQDGYVPYEADLVLPYLAASSGEAPVSVQALVFKKQQLAVSLSPQESSLLACLQGVGELAQLPVLHDAAPENQLGPVSCHTEVSGNGELKHPKLRIKLKLGVHGDRLQGKDVRSLEQSIREDALSLLRRLQEKQVDPLRLGETIRTRYLGYWSDERWRKAYAHADVDVQAVITKLGGAGT